MLGLSTTELILIVLAIVLLFGASRLPQLAKSLGQTKKAFKEGMRDAEEDESPSVKQINSAQPGLGAATLSDEEILAEMQRRAESKSQA